tara:strand:+ start:131 stop:490 length:360 start_codon:yes stop_codon:yes gene_type:complete
MEEEQQWEKDNGDITIDLNSYFKYSGETEKDVTFTSGDQSFKRPVLPTKYAISRFVEKYTRPGAAKLRANIIYRHLRYPQLTRKQLANRLQCTVPSVKGALDLYFIHKKELKIKYKYYL